MRAGAFRAAAVSFERRAQFRAGVREFRASGAVSGGRANEHQRAPEAQPSGHQAGGQSPTCAGERARR